MKLFKSLVLFLLISFPVCSFADCEKSYKCWQNELRETMDDLNFSNEQQDYVNKFINAHFFIDSQDYQHFLLSKPKKPWSLYDNSGGKPFDNFQITWNYLTDDDKEFSTKLALEIHKRMMAHNVDNLPGYSLGVLRTLEVIGTGPYSKRSIRLPKRTCEIMKKSEYIDFEEYKIPESSSYPNDCFGIIKYPYIMAPEKILSKLTPEFAEQVKRFSNSSQSESQKEQMNAKMVEELLNDLWNWMEHEGSSMNPYRAAAAIQQRFVSIHPFRDGNGRSSRMFMFYQLFLNDLPPAILKNPDEDLYKNLDEWEVEVKNGVASTINLYRDVISRLKSGLNLHSNAIILKNYLPPKDTKGNPVNADFFKQYFKIMKGQFTETQKMDKNFEYFEMIEFLKVKYLKFQETFLGFKDGKFTGIRPVTYDEEDLIKMRFRRHAEFTNTLGKFYTKDLLKVRNKIGAWKTTESQIAYLFENSGPFTTAKAAGGKNEAGLEKCFESFNYSIFNNQIKEEIRASISGKGNLFFVTKDASTYTSEFKEKHDPTKTKDTLSFLKNMFRNDLELEVVFRRPLIGEINKNEVQNYLSINMADNYSLLACSIHPESIEIITLYKQGKPFRMYKRDNDQVHIFEVVETDIYKVDTETLNQ